MEKFLKMLDIYKWIRYNNHTIEIDSRVWRNWQTR